MATRYQRSARHLPSVRVLNQPAPLRSRVAGAVDAVRPVATGAATYVFGLWPLTLVVALTAALLYAAGVANAP